MIVVLYLIFNFLLTETGNKKGADTEAGFRIKIIIFLVIGFAQIIFSSVNTYKFKNYYLDINRQKALTITSLLKEDIEFFLSKHIKINKLFKIDTEMREIVDNAPELYGITIFDKDHSPLYQVTRTDNNKTGVAVKREKSEAESPDYNVSLEIKNNKLTEGYIATGISKQVLMKKLFDIGLDSATVIVISFLFFGELMILFFRFLGKKASKSGAPDLDYRAIRPMAFFFLFCSDISISFLPLHMEALYDKPILGLSKTMVMGLPISMEMFASGISALFAGVWVDKRGWYEPFIFGLGLVLAGLIYSWQAQTAIPFIFARGLVGFGYGLALIAAQGFVILNSNDNSNAQGLSQLFAGVYAGSICGAAMGAMLAERVGFRPVFFIAGIILAVVIFFTVMTMRRSVTRKSAAKKTGNSPGVSLKQLVRFFTNRSIVGLVLFGIIPSAIAVVGFINYFFPIYLDRLGTSQSNIGRLYMLFGLCLIYLAPAISRVMDASDSKKKYLFVNGALGSIAFMIYSFFGGIAVTAVAVLLMSLSICYDASRPYALKFKETHDLGVGKSLSIFISFEKIGQVIGPILLGVVFIAPDINKAIAFLGCGYLLLTCVFMIVAKNDGGMNPKTKHKC